MGVWRGLLMSAAIAAGGCSPPESRYIGAVDPLGNIPAIQKAGDTHDRTAIPALVGQLNDDDPAIRFYAIGALTKITGQTLDYHYYETADQRRPAVERWKQWLKQRTPGK